MPSLIVLTIIGALAVFLAYLANWDESNFSLKVAFFLVFAFLALRYDYGNDYQAYLQDFGEIQNIQSFSANEVGEFEPGWRAISYMFSGFGFFALIIFLAAVNCVIYYYFVQKYAAKEFYWIAVLLYIFSPGLMLTQLTAMRQTVAIIIFLFSLRYIVNKKPIKYILCVALAASCHASGWLMLPFILIGYINFKMTTNWVIAISLFYLVLFVWGDVLLPPIFNVAFQLMSKYENFAKLSAAAQLGSGIGLMLSLFIFISLLIASKGETGQNSIVYKMALFSFIFTPIAMVMPMVGRIGMYFLPFTMVAYPLMLKKANSIAFKACFIGIVLFLNLYAYYAFFFSPVWHAKFWTYQTILSAPQWY